MNVRERPILFTSKMVRAVLDGRKTHTRKIIKGVEDWPMVRGCDGGASWAIPSGHPYPERGFKKCPYGMPGDHLYVRERCRAEELPDGVDGVRYEADNAFIPIEDTKQADDRWVHMNRYRTKAGAKRGTWLNSIHVPRWACRITLEVVSVRVERVQDIRGSDAIDEGIDMDAVAEAWGKPGNRDAAVIVFEQLWDSINAGRGYGWGVNPWVWVVEFKVLSVRSN